MADVGRRGRILVQPAQGDGGGRVAFEWPASGEHLEQDDPQGVHVRGAGHLVAACLLGTEVMHRPERRAGDGHRGLADRPRDPEVGDLHVAGVGDHDVARLHVAVDDPLPMRRLQRARGPDRDANRVVGRQGTTLAQDRRQVAPIDELHDDVLLAIGPVGAVVVDADDVRVRQAPRGARLLLESGREAGIGAKLRPKDLDRDLAIELLVHGAPDRRHAAVAEGRDQPVPAADQPAEHLHGVSLAGRVRGCSRGSRPRRRTRGPSRRWPSASRSGCRHRGGRPRTGNRTPAARG